MSNTTRQPGYYRVKLNGYWVIAQYLNYLIDQNVWQLSGIRHLYKDQDFNEIDPTPINPEPQHGCNPNQVYTANTVGPNSIQVTGLLSVISRQFMHIEPGYYISNSADAPFAYQVNPLSVRIATVADQEAGKV